MKKHLTRIFSRGILAAVLLGTSTVEGALPLLEIVKTGTTATNADSIALGTLEYKIDLKLDTGGDPISGLQLYLLSSDPSVVFGLTPVVALNNPFTNADILIAPSPGDILNQAEGTSVLFKLGAGDYPAFSSQAILTYTLDTSSLAPGDYLLTPVGEELTFTSMVRDTFELPGEFTLTVRAVPEPSTFIWGLSVVSMLAAIRRRGRARRADETARRDAIA